LLQEDLRSAALVLRAILAAGLARAETRGCFLRSDYPAQDDASWLKNSRVTWDPAANGFDVEYLPAEAGAEPSRRQ
jgi:succinate dehydrogenase/fumarate reductase flavoprotein subunit